MEEKRDQASTHTTDTTDGEESMGGESGDPIDSDGAEGTSGEEAGDRSRDSWAPWGALSELQEAVGGIVDTALRNVGPGAGRYPRYDVYELPGEGYRLLFDLPGLEKDDVDVSISGHELTVSGERRRPELPEGAEAHRSERSHGRFRRSLTVPADADASRISAKMTSGVLEVRLAFAGKDEAQRVQVD